MSEHGVTIRTNGREAKHLSAITSPTKDFEPTGERGVYFMPADDEVQALHRADFLTRNGVEVLDAR